MRTVGKQFLVDRAVGLQEPVLQIQVDQFILVASHSSVDSVGLLTLCPLGLVGHRQDPHHDHPRAGQPPPEHLGYRSGAMGHILGRTVGAQAPLDLAAGAPAHHEIVGAAQKHRHLRGPPLGEVQVAMGRPVEHDGSNVAGVTHVDGVVTGVVPPDIFACGAAKRPVPGDGIAKKHDLRITRLGDLAIDPLELPAPISIFDFPGHLRAGGSRNLVPEMPRRGLVAAGLALLRRLSSQTGPTGPCQQGRDDCDCSYIVAHDSSASKPLRGWRYSTCRSPLPVSGEGTSCRTDKHPDR